MIRSTLEISGGPEIGFEFIVCVENAFQLILKYAPNSTQEFAKYTSLSITNDSPTLTNPF
jgi:hypothetical protein